MPVFKRLHHVLRRHGRVDDFPPLDGCECRTAVTWEAPPAWLLDCAAACKTGNCTCDFATLQAMVCGDAPNKCLGKE